MPGDTTIINTLDTLAIPDTLIDQHQAAVPSPYSQGSDNTGFVLLAVFVCIFIVPFLFNWLRKKYKQEQAFRVAENHAVQFDEWLSAYNGYYKTLAPDLRQRFLKRVSWFMSTKTFTCIHMPEEGRMALLISAASIQITFGLEKYLLEFFDTIYIMRHNYKYGMYNRPFEGHVNGNGIYLSWDNFLRGYEDYTDADNVGIHEMAHALAYVNFMTDNTSAKDVGFIQRFELFSTVARPIFESMQNGTVTLLDAYAATNYNEFWAVSVETFFEKSLEMKVEMPHLYTAMCQLLNQDPLTPEKLLAIPGSVQV